jgi:hypothetical protein
MSPGINPNRKDRFGGTQGGDMHQHDPDSLRLMTRERHDRRLREGDAERLAREIRGTHWKRSRLPLILGFALATGRRVAHTRLQA